MSERIYTENYVPVVEPEVIEDAANQPSSKTTTSVVTVSTSNNTSAVFDYDRAVSIMTEEKRKKYLDLAAKEIDIERPSSIRHYGQDITKAVSNIADKIIDKTRSDKTNETIDLTNSLVIELKSLGEKNDDDQSFWKRIKRLPVVRSIVKKAVETKVENTTVGNNVREISEQFVAMKSDAMAQTVIMEDLHTTCRDYVVQSREKTLGIIVMREEVKKKLAELEASDIADLDEIQRMRLADNELSKKITTLETNEHLFQQNMFQIAALQSNFSSIIDKCENALQLIPVVRLQLAMAGTTDKQRNQVDATIMFDEFSNEILVKNMQALHDESIGLAKAMETPSIRLETLQQTKNTLIDMVRSVKEIKDRGEEQREQIRQGLQTLSDELNEALRNDL